MPSSPSISRVIQLTAVSLVVAMVLLALNRRASDVATAQIVAHALKEPAGTDSTLYMRLGEQAFQREGSSLYAKLFFEDHQKFLYPPFSLWFIQGLDRLPRWHISPERVWKILLTLCWLGSITTAILFYKQQKSGLASAWELAAVAVLALLFLPFAEAFYRGQVQMLLTLLWGLAALCYGNGKRVTAGALLAMTCAFKPQLAFFLLWGASRREWRFTAAFAATTGVLLAGSLAHFGLQSHLDYLRVLAYLGRHGEALAANQSMNGLLNRLLANGESSVWNATAYPPFHAGVYVASTAFSIACLLAGLVLPRMFRWGRSSADLLLFGCVSVLMSPIAWEHHYSYFFLAIVYLLAQAETLAPLAWCALVIALLALSNRWPWLDVLNTGRLSLAGDYLFFGALVVLGLLTAIMAGALQRTSSRASRRRLWVPGMLNHLASPADIAST